MTRKDRRRKVTPEMIGRMKELRDEGLSYGRVAERLNLAPMTVYNYLKKKEKRKARFFEGLKRKIAIMVIAIVVLSAACVGCYLLTSEVELPEVEYETYINENYSFRFDYPSDWIFREQKIPWFGISYFNAIENVPENEIGGAFGLTVREPGSWENAVGPSLDDIRSQIISQIENNENYTILSGPTDTIIGKTIAFKCSVSIFYPTGNITIQTGLIYAVKDNYLYNLNTFSKKEKYSNYKRIFEHVIDSFSFLGSENKDHQV